MGKRGQFTIIVVFALVAILAITIVFLARNSLQAVEASSAAQDYAQSDAVQRFVGSCLKAVTEDVLARSAFQGGVIEVVDGLPVNISGEEIMTSYFLKGISSSECNLNYTAPPEYPFPDTKYEELNISLFRADKPGGAGCSYYRDREAGFLGVRTMARTCLLNGPNWDEEPDNLDDIRPSFFRICESYAREEMSSMQGQAINMTQQKLSACTGNFSSLSKVEGVDIRFGEPEVEILLGRDGVLSRAVYPVTATSPGSSPETFTASYQHRVPVRLLELYEFLRDIIKRDVQDPEFYLAESYADSPRYRSGFSIARIKCPEADDSRCFSADEDQPDDIVIASDGVSVLKGDSLKIMGAIQNRRPVLDPVESRDTISLPGFLQNRFDISVLFGNRSEDLQEMKNLFTANDPDKDELEYSITPAQSNPNHNPGLCNQKMREFLVELKLYNQGICDVNNEDDNDCSDEDEDVADLFNEAADACVPSSRHPNNGLGPPGLQMVNVSVTDGSLRDYQENVIMLMIPKGLWNNIMS